MTTSQEFGCRSRYPVPTPADKQVANPVWQYERQQVPSAYADIPKILRQESDIAGCFERSFKQQQ